MSVNRNPESYFRDNDIVPFVGVVENTSDPMQIGRVQVRAISFHPERAQGGVPTEDLPWAYVVLPTTASGMSGIGSTHGLLDGSWVFGYFMDGRDAQQPFVLGAFQGAPGLTPLQGEYLNSGLGISSTAPGGLSAAFQTIKSSVAGGLGEATKFGTTIGSMLSLANLFKNDDAVQTLTQVMGLGPTGQSVPALSSVIDAATADSIKTATVAAAAAVPGLGAAALQLPQVLLGIFSSGGATGIPDGIGGSPLSSASFGTTAAPGSEVNSNNVTVDVKTDYEQLAGSAPDNTGMITVHSTGTPKTARYTLAALNSASNPGATSNPAGGHLAIDQTGQILQIKPLTATGDHTAGMNTPTVGGTSMQNIGITLIGGQDSEGGESGTLTSKFYPVQLATLDKLIGAFIRKFPKAVISGANEIAATGSPGFNVSEWAKALWPNNVNTTTGGDKQITGTATGTVGAALLSAVTQVTSSGASTTSTDEATQNQPNYTGNKRGFQGGPSHPRPSYASKQQSDVPAFARGNALTTGSGDSSIGAAQGGPLQQYLAKIEESSLWNFFKARMSDTLEARAVPNTWSVPVSSHGGEYGQAHVVRSTEGGHHILLDDTGGREKVEIMHSSGSMLQIRADGSGHFYVKKDNHEVVIGDKFIGVQGDLHMSVGGSLKMSVKGDWVVDATGKITLNGASDMHELIRGNRTTVTEGSHLIQAKKNMSQRVGKDMSTHVGGKLNTAVRSTRHDVTEGTSTTTNRGETYFYGMGNRSSLLMASDHTHAQNIIAQAEGDTMSVSGGNIMQSAKGKITVVGAGDVLVQSQGSTKLIGASGVNVTASGGEVDIVASGAAKLSAGGQATVIGASTKITADGELDLAGSSIFSTTTIPLGGSAGSRASAATGTTPSDVEAPPAQVVTRESNNADSGGNLNAEQVTMGEIDDLAAQDAQGEASGSGGGGQTPSGGLNSSGASSSSSPTFNPATSSGQVDAAPSLKNYKESACSIAGMLVAKGWSQQGASAIVGNMINESSLNPTVPDHVDVNGLSSGGLIQWNGARLTAMRNYAAAHGLNPSTVEAQIGFLDQEARTTMSTSGGGMINASDMESAIIAAANFEVFKGYKHPFTGEAWENNNGNRASNALGVYNVCFGGNVTSVGGQSAANANISGYPGGGTGASSSGTSTAGTGTGGAPGGGNGTDSNSVSTGMNDQGKPSGTKAPLVTGNGSWRDLGQKLSDHYTLGDLTPTCKIDRDIEPTPHGSITATQLITNLSGCAVNVVEALRSHFGNCHVMCGYRSLAYNNGLRSRSSGVAYNSDHIYGRATDIKVTGVPPRVVADWVLQNLPFVAGVGRYPTFTHVSYYIEGNHGKIRQWGSN